MIPSMLFFLFLFIPSFVLAVPSPTPAPTAIGDTNPNKRQDLPELLALASAAGIVLPTDPAVLLGLYPLATELIGYLPTEPVLSVLETAVPSGFISEIVHDPSFAASFEQAFASGAPPSWFSSLPSEVRSYLHTYQASSLASQIESVESGLATLQHTIIGQSQSGSARFGPLASDTALSAETESTASVSALQSTSDLETFTTSPQDGTSNAITSYPSSRATAATSGVSSSAQSAVSGASSRTSTPVNSSSTSACAPRETHMLFAGVAVALGVVGAVELL